MVISLLALALSWELYLFKSRSSFPSYSHSQNWSLSCVLIFASTAVSVCRQEVAVCCHYGYVVGTGFVLAHILPRHLTFGFTFVCSSLRRIIFFLDSRITCELLVVFCTSTSLMGCLSELFWM